MGQPLRLLLVEDSSADAELLLFELRMGGFEPIYERVDTPEEMRAALEKGGWDIIISDFVMPRFSGLAALELAQEMGNDLPFIVVTGQVGEETAVEAMRAGAHDYVLKGNLTRLIPAIQRELCDAKVRRERKKADEALRKAYAELEIRVEERTAELQAVIENMVDAVIVANADGRVTLVNRAGLRLLGMASVEEATRALDESPEIFRMRNADGTPVAPEDLPVSRALAGEIVTSKDEILRNPRSRRDVRIRTNATPIRDETGRISGAVLVTRDVTDLIEFDLLKDEFISVAAHELKTPVAIMKGYAQALLQKANDISPHRRRMLDAIDRGADRIDRIVRDLLDISQLHLGPLQLIEERIDLVEFVEGIVARMALTTTKHQLQIVRADPVVIEGDRSRLEQVLVNVIDNAIKYSPSGGDIDVSVGVRDGEVVVSVHDHGIGIPEGKQKHISERFYRAHSGTQYDYGGMGVGLFISREIITRHGGKAWFKSEEGTGSTFSFSLPLREGQGAT